ncbi:hypothetical protein C7S18_04030 [Ahniella affigens]|uniref:Uncharacterized protein n=1 Tax=Ahniella affigens TaxID=2021234 RepID=A0A2P1PNJ8_9GAMM|nr:hypothetical protein C7S18_04030 [Ahniella affigens]
MGCFAAKLFRAALAPCRFATIQLLLCQGNRLCENASISPNEAKVFGSWCHYCRHPGSRAADSGIQGDLATCSQRWRTEHQIDRLTQDCSGSRLRQDDDNRGCHREARLTPIEHSLMHEMASGSLHNIQVQVESTIVVVLPRNIAH